MASASVGAPLDRFLSFQAPSDSVDDSGGSRVVAAGIRIPDPEPMITRDVSDRIDVSVPPRWLRVQLRDAFYFSMPHDSVPLRLRPRFAWAYGV